MRVCYSSRICSSLKVEQDECPKLSGCLGTAGAENSSMEERNESSSALYYISAARLSNKQDLKLCAGEGADKPQSEDGKCKQDLALQEEVGWEDT